MSRIARALLLLLLAGLAAGLLALLGTRRAGLPPLGTLLDPADGLYRTARHAVPLRTARRALPALEAPVTVLRDDRGVPHIFAESDRDAIRALGYVTAQDRLFQMDFIARVAAGQLASALGPAAVETDRFLRSTGMDWGARRNLQRLREEDGLEWDLTSWYAAGVNAYLDGLAPADWPFEFRLLGYRPRRFSPLNALRLLQYMTYDLTYYTDEAAYAALQERLSAVDYKRLYPRFAQGLFAPIVPQGVAPDTGRASVTSTARSTANRAARRVLQARADFQKKLRGTLLEGFVPGKGSNNWAVGKRRSATGAPILAGDMHLGLTLPAIWYEVHLVTPTMNTYGVTIPGAPLPVEAFNEHVGWTFTNTGADQIDHLALTLDESGTRYRFGGQWRDLERVPDTIQVNGGAPVIDTLRYAHWGPVQTGEGGGAVALRWVAHERSRTLGALWGMNHAETAADFEAALRQWDTPMQNILYATKDRIAIRSTGRLPLRRAGTGAGLLDGSSRAHEWIGRVPFGDLPHADGAQRGFLFSANQQPTDSTYGYYLGHDWRDGWRSLRIDTLLRRKQKHTVDDLKRYQSDVHAVQRDVYAPLLDTLGGLSARARALRRMLGAWDGAATTGRPEPLVLEAFLEALRRLAWDEPPFRGDVPRPQDAPLLKLLTETPASKWLDVQATPEREDAAGLLRRALEDAADTLAARHGWTPQAWRWGDESKVLFRHLTHSEVLRPLWRGPFEFPGFAATLSPAGGHPTTHSASWRVVVDFSTTPPRGYGVYPGGQSGNPFSPLYDLHLPAYLRFKHYDLLKPAAPADLDSTRVLSRLTLAPAAER